MGECMKPTSMKLGPDCERKLYEIQDAFAPTFASRSHMLRFLISVMHRIVFSGENLERFVLLLQGIQGSTSCYQDSLSAANRGTLKIDPKRVTALGEERSKRPAKTSTCLKVDMAATELAAFSFSFHRSICVRLAAGSVA